MFEIGKCYQFRDKYSKEKFFGRVLGIEDGVARVDHGTRPTWYYNVNTGVSMHGGRHLLDADNENQKNGYHLKEIKKGELGKSSKIREELEELEDAEQQGNRILAVCELSDLVGAIKAYLRSNYENFSLEDLDKMSEATERAFKSGQRK